MKIAYLDTNILVSFIKPNDPNYNSSSIILAQPFVKNFISTLTLVEVKSVISRQLIELVGNLPSNIIKAIDGLSDEEKIEILYKYLLESITIEIHENVAIQEDTYSFYKGKIFSVYSLALQLANTTKLRVLDNLQLAHALLIHQQSLDKIDYFVTGDANFIKQISSAKKYLPFSIISPENLLTLERV